MRISSVLDAIGNTPVVDVSFFSPRPRVKIWAKLEGGNPGGSVKDRTAKYLFQAAEEKRLLVEDRILIEPTSGNTGIALAMIAAAKGYRFTAVMPESASVERRKLLKAFGADIILTDGKKGTNGAIEVAREMVARDPIYFMFDQFENEANPLAHYETTGAEIIADVPEVDALVAGLGTGGTITGTGKRLKEYQSNIKVFGIEPSPDSAVEGLRNMKEYKPSVFDEGLLDAKLEVPDGEAFKLARKLYRHGIAAGISSGAALWGAIRVAEWLGEGTVVTIFPDRGDKYLSTRLFAD